MTDEEASNASRARHERDQALRHDWPTPPHPAHADRAALLAEVERLREENRHHRVTAMDRVSRGLHDAAIAEQATEIERLREALRDIARGDYSDPCCALTPEGRARNALEGGP